MTTELTSMADQYLYILSNPSMPGLIKVGKTTTHPDQRMAELHSTGVPTPFELECSFAVPDCHESERKAHNALRAYRVANNREFFRLSVKSAIEKIIEVIGPFTLHEARASYGVEKLEQKIKQRMADRERQAVERRDAEQRRETELRYQKTRNYTALKQAIQLENEKLNRLGPRPEKPEQSGFATLCQFCYYPIPLGWLAWISIIQIFEPKRTWVGVIAAILVWLGWHFNSKENEALTEHNKLLAPYRLIDDKLYELKKKLSEMEAENPSLKTMG